jgi:hypothetical protein
LRDGILDTGVWFHVFALIKNNCLTVKELKKCGFIPTRLYSTLQSIATPTRERNLVTFLLYRYIPKQRPKQNAFVGTVVAVILSLKQQKLLLLIGRVCNCSIAGLLFAVFAGVCCFCCSYLLLNDQTAKQSTSCGLLGY